MMHLAPKYASYKKNFLPLTRLGRGLRSLKVTTHSSLCSSDGWDQVPRKHLQAHLLGPRILAKLKQLHNTFLLGSLNMSSHILRQIFTEKFEGFLFFIYFSFGLCLTSLSSFMIDFQDL